MAMGRPVTSILKGVLLWRLHPANSLGIEFLGGVTITCNITNVNDMDGV
jgi:hypothetical protein